MSHRSSPEHHSDYHRRARDSSLYIDVIHHPPRVTASYSHQRILACLSISTIHLLYHREEVVLHLRISTAQAALNVCKWIAGCLFNDFDLPYDTPYCYVANANAKERNKSNIDCHLPSPKHVPHASTYTHIVNSKQAQL